MDIKHIIDYIYEEIIWKLRSLRNMYYFVEHYIKADQNLKTGVKRGHYSDYVYKIEQALFIAVEDYIARDCEDAFSVVDFDWNEDHREIKTSIIEILHFYRIELPELEAESEKLLKILYPATSSLDQLLENVNNKTSERNELNIVYRKLEKEILDRTHEMLHKVIDIRCYLWS